ncbi:MAG: hydroxymethylglutaryl-CoA lyase [Tepidisphaeraceae bacterium]
MRLPDRVKILDVTARDGIEALGRAVPVDPRVELVNRLSDAGLAAIEIGAFVNPKAIPAMAGSDEVSRKIGRRKGVEYVGLVPNLRGLNDAIACGVRHVEIFTAATESFCQANINCSIEESFARFAPVMEEASKHGVIVRGMVSCVFGCPYEGDVAPETVAPLVSRLHKLGCAEVGLGDTIGVGTPRSVGRLVEACERAGVPVASLSAHFHNTCGMALANCYAAMEMGVGILEGGTGGLGGCPNAPGASGNVATEELVYMLDGMGIESGVDLKKVVNIAQWITNELGTSMDSKIAAAMSNPGMTYFDKIGQHKREG